MSSRNPSCAGNAYPAVLDWPAWRNLGLMTAAAPAAATGAAGTGHRAGCGAGGRAAVGFRAVGGRSEDRKLDGVFPAFALRADDGLLLVHDDAFVVSAAVVADIFVDRHQNSPRKLSHVFQVELILHFKPFDSPKHVPPSKE